MENERYQRGVETLRALGAEESGKVLARLREIAPHFANYAIEFPFGDVYSKPVLDLKTRELAAVAGLTALGYAGPQLKVHIAFALNAGATREEVVEVIVQMVVYAGFPAAINGLFAAQEVFQERGTEEQAKS